MITLIIPRCPLTAHISSTVQRNRKQRRKHWPVHLLASLVLSPPSILLAAALGSPLIAFLGLPILLPGFPRPARMWPSMGRSGSPWRSRAEPLCISSHSPPSIATFTPIFTTTTTTNNNRGRVQLGNRLGPVRPYGPLLFAGTEPGGIGWPHPSPDHGLPLLGPLRGAHPPGAGGRGLV